MYVFIYLFISLYRCTHEIQSNLIIRSYMDGFKIQQLNLHIIDFYVYYRLSGDRTIWLVCTVTKKEKEIRVLKTY